MDVSSGILNKAASSNLDDSEKNDENTSSKSGSEQMLIKQEYGDAKQENFNEAQKTTINLEEHLHDKNSHHSIDKRGCIGSDVSIGGNKASAHKSAYRKRTHHSYDHYKSHNNSTGTSSERSKIAHGDRKTSSSSRNEHHSSHREKHKHGQHSQHHRSHPHRTHMKPNDDSKSSSAQKNSNEFVDIQFRPSDTIVAQSSTTVYDNLLTLSETKDVLYGDNNVAKHGLIPTTIVGVRCPFTSSNIRDKSTESNATSHEADESALDQEDGVPTKRIKVKDMSSLLLKRTKNEMLNLVSPTNNADKQYPRLSDSSSTLSATSTLEKQADSSSEMQSYELLKSPVEINRIMQETKQQSASTNKTLESELVDANSTLKCHFAESMELESAFNIQSMTNIGTEESSVSKSDNSMEEGIYLRGYSPSGNPLLCYLTEDPIAGNNTFASNTSVNEFNAAANNEMAEKAKTFAQFSLPEIPDNDQLTSDLQVVSPECKDQNDVSAEVPYVNKNLPMEISEPIAPPMPVTGPTHSFNQNTNNETIEAVQQPPNIPTTAIKTPTLKPPNQLNSIESSNQQQNLNIPETEMNAAAHVSDNINLQIEQLDTDVKSTEPENKRTIAGSTTTAPKEVPLHIVDHLDENEEIGNGAAATKYVNVSGNIANVIEKPNYTRRRSTYKSRPSHYSAQDDFYRKPFEYGWKRELVWRANLDTNSSKADVYFISPSGKKMRSRSEIQTLLEGDLTIDHFCFIREPQGAGDEFELVRNAKTATRSIVAAPTANSSCRNSLNNNSTISSPNEMMMGKRVVKPKAPKGASPPPTGWTPARTLRNINNLSSSRRKTPSPKIKQVKNVAAKSNANSTELKATSIAVSLTASTITPTAVITTVTDLVPIDPNNALPQPMLPSVVLQNSNQTVIKSTSPYTCKNAEHCIPECTKLSEEKPQLKCKRCQRFFHHECVHIGSRDDEYRRYNALLDPGMGTVHEFICLVCYSKVTDATLDVSTTMRHKSPQKIVVLNGKKYISLDKSMDNLPTRIVVKRHMDPNKHKFQNQLDLKEKAGARPLPLIARNTLFGSLSDGYNILVSVMKHIKINERNKLASVCRLWEQASKDRRLWKTVQLKNLRITDWPTLTTAMHQNGTIHLDLRKMHSSLVPSNNQQRMEIRTFLANIINVPKLEIIDFCRCTAKVIETIMNSNTNLRVLNALSLQDEAISLLIVQQMPHLRELRLNSSELYSVQGDLHALASCQHLTHLTLTAVNNLHQKSIVLLSSLRELRTLELGDCGNLNSKNFSAMLQLLTKLRRLRLETGMSHETVGQFCMLDLLDGLIKVPSLVQLELINFDVKPGFDVKLANCVNIRKLLLIPTYIAQSANTNHIILNAVLKLPKQLESFTWVFTIELCRVTALYSNSKDETKNESIPVLEPVPGMTTQYSNAIVPPKANEQHVAIVTIRDVEQIMHNNLPNMKFAAIKIFHNAIFKQKLIE